MTASNVQLKTLGRESLHTASSSSPLKCEGKSEGREGFTSCLVPLALVF